MKRLWKAFLMCLGMFTVIPCPQGIWDDDERGLMTLCLPLVGAVIGAIWTLGSLLASALLPMPLAAAFIAVLPFVLTGFMHLDGFLDTSDALLSWRPLEKRQEILKDVHIGAMGVIHLMVLMLMSYGAAASLKYADMRVLVLVPVISRCCSALCVISIKPIGHSQYTHVDGTREARITLLAIWAVAMIIGAIWLGKGILALLLCTCGYAGAILWATHSLKGISGDLAGFALSISECLALMTLAIL